MIFFINRRNLIIFTALIWLAIIFEKHDCAKKIIAEKISIYQPADFRVELLFILQDKYKPPMAKFMHEMRQKHIRRIIRTIEERYKDVRVGFARFTSDKNFCLKCPVVSLIETNLTKSIEEFEQYKPSDKDELIESTQLHTIAYCGSRSAVGWNITDYSPTYPNILLKIMMVFVDTAPNATDPTQVPSCFHVSTSVAGGMMRPSKNSHVIFAWSDVAEQWRVTMQELTLNSDNRSKGTIVSLNAHRLPLIYEIFLQELLNASDRAYDVPHKNYLTLNRHNLTHYEVSPNTIEPYLERKRLPYGTCEEIFKEKYLQLHISVLGSNKLSSCLETYDFGELYKTLTLLKRSFKELSYGISYHTSTDHVCDKNCDLKLPLTSDIEVINKPLGIGFKRMCSNSAANTQLADVVTCLQSKEFEWTRPRYVDSYRVFLFIASRPVSATPLLEIPGTGKKNSPPPVEPDDYTCLSTMPDLFGEALFKAQAYPLIIAPRKYATDWENYFSQMGVHGLVAIEDGDIEDIENISRLVKETICGDLSSKDKLKS